jgi:hypothetical protein
LVDSFHAQLCPKLRRRPIRAELNEHLAELMPIFLGAAVSFPPAGRSDSSRSKHRCGAFDQFLSHKAPRRASLSHGPPPANTRRRASFAGSAAGAGLGPHHTALRDAASSIGFQHDFQQVHHVIIVGGAAVTDAGARRATLSQRSARKQPGQPPFHLGGLGWGGLGGGGLKSIRTSPLVS